MNGKIRKVVVSVISRFRSPCYLMVVVLVENSAVLKEFLKAVCWADQMDALMAESKVGALVVGSVDLKAKTGSVYRKERNLVHLYVWVDWMVVGKVVGWVESLVERTVALSNNDAHKRRNRQFVNEILTISIGTL